MRIGDLNKFITIQQQTKAPDGMGGFTATWADVATSVPAAIWPISANETVQAMATGMTITHRIRIRYRAVFKPVWRLSWANRYFNIVSVIDPNMDHRYLDLMCKEAA